jgi:hypothetical protein
MKTILQRKDNTSICCPSLNQPHATFTVKTKVIGVTVACILIMVGFFIKLIVH